MRDVRAYWVRKRASEQQSEKVSCPAKQGYHSRPHGRIGYKEAKPTSLKVRLLSKLARRHSRSSHAGIKHEVRNRGVNKAQVEGQANCSRGSGYEFWL